MKFQKFAWYLGLLLAARTCLAQTDPSIKVFDVLGATATYPVSINNSGDITGSFCTKVYPCEETDRSGFVRDRDGSITTFDGIPSGINDKGVIAGYLTDHQHFFLRDKHGNTTLFLLPQAFPYASGWTVAINNKEEITGYFIPEPGSDAFLGFVLDSRGYAVFGLPDGTIPAGINDHGDVTGYTAPYSGIDVDGFVRDKNGNITVFDAPDPTLEPNCIEPNTYPSGINDHRVTAGTVEDCSQSHGFIRSWNGRIEVFDAIPDALDTTVSGINDRGVVLGSFFLPNYGYFQFLRPRGHTAVFDVPGAASSVSINNHDDVTGYFHEGTLVHGFVHRARCLPLNDKRPHGAASGNEDRPCEDRDPFHDDVSRSD